MNHVKLLGIRKEGNCCTGCEGTGLEDPALRGRRRPQNGGVPVTPRVRGTEIGHSQGQKQTGGPLGLARQGVRTAGDGVPVSGEGLQRWTVLTVHKNMKVLSAPDFPHRKMATKVNYYSKICCIIISSVCQKLQDKQLWVSHPLRSGVSRPHALPRLSEPPARGARCITGRHRTSTGCGAGPRAAQGGQAGPTPARSFLSPDPCGGLGLGLAILLGAVSATLINTGHKHLLW